MNYGDTSLGGNASRFPHTEWTRIEDPLQRQAVMEELCERYWKPLYRFLRHQGFSNDTAKDMIQGFFTDKVLGQELIGRADRSRGRFRSFMLTALRNYVANVLKIQQRRSPSLEEIDHLKVDTDPPERAFDRAWAEQPLKRVLADLEAECHFKEKTIHWQIFRAWLLDMDTKRTDMTEICRRYQVPNPSTAYNMVANLKKRFRAILRDHLSLLVESEAQIDDEIDCLIKSFSK